MADAAGSSCRVAARRGPRRATAYLLLLLLLLLPACTNDPTTDHAGSPTSTASTDEPALEPEDDEPAGLVTLAFAGDLHFQLHLDALLDRPRRGLGSITRQLREPDLTMVNLETAITRRGVPEPKKFHFRTSPAALDFLAAAGVDVVSLGNNHAVDYGPLGLRDTLRARRNSPVPVLGVGRNESAAFAPYRVSVRGTDLAFFAASSRDERTSRAWSAGPGSPGVATTLGPHAEVLVAAVSEAAERDDVVVVYLHWGKEYQRCPTVDQRRTARAVAEAGADIIVGSHTHVLLGAGWLDDTYVGYGLGNFVWYHNSQSETGVLRVRIRDGEVVGDAWSPALIRPSGIPRPLAGQARSAAIADWRRLRGCADLAAEPRS